MDCIVGYSTTRPCFFLPKAKKNQESICFPLPTAKTKTKTNERHVHSTHGFNLITGIIATATNSSAVQYSTVTSTVFI